jgi:hypothetical protein
MNALFYKRLQIINLKHNISNALAYFQNVLIREEVCEEWGKKKRSIK